MPVAIIVGVPKPLADRVVGAQRNAGGSWLDGWGVRFVLPDVGGKRLLLSETCLENARVEAEAVGDSAHVLAITNQGGDSKRKITDLLSPYFRLRWLPPEWLSSSVTPADVYEGLCAVMQEEAEWFAAVKPQHESNALLLPEVAFSTKVTDLWRQAAKYGEMGTIAAYKKALKAFELSHYRKQEARHGQSALTWTDDRNRVFDHRGERHGVAPGVKKWKFSYRMVDGFHYDVTHEKKRQFEIMCATGLRSVCADRHINVDPHGYPRGS